MKPNETIDFHVRWAWQKIAKLYNSEAVKHDFTMSMGYVLLNIDSKTGTPSTKLGPKMGIESRSLTRILKTMEEKRLITRIKDDSDKRLVIIKLTDLGKEKRNISRATVFKFNQEIESKIGNKKWESFLEMAAEINEILDQNNIFNHE